VDGKLSQHCLVPELRKQVKSASHFWFGRLAAKSLSRMLSAITERSPSSLGLPRRFGRARKPFSRIRRTREALTDAVADILATVTPQECSNYLKHDGCEQT
jgi:hypothetical protein